MNSRFRFFSWAKTAPAIPRLKNKNKTRMCRIRLMGVSRKRRAIGSAPGLLGFQFLDLLVQRLEAFDVGVAGVLLLAFDGRPAPVVLVHERFGAGPDRL